MRGRRSTVGRRILQIRDRARYGRPRGRRRGCRCHPRRAAGSRTSKLHPFPALTTRTWPLCASTMPRTIVKPEPRAAIGVRRPGSAGPPGKVEHPCQVGLGYAAAAVGYGYDHLASLGSCGDSHAAAFGSVPDGVRYQVGQRARQLARIGVDGKWPVGLAGQPDAAGLCDGLHARYRVADQVADCDPVRGKAAASRIRCGTARTGRRPCWTAG